MIPVGECYRFAKVAVSAAAFHIDHPYDYCIPPEYLDQVGLGVRVAVRFGRGNKECEAVILSLSENTDIPNPKNILRVLDPYPVINREMIALILWLRETCFCTFYDLLRAVLPGGLFYNFEQKYRISSDLDPETAETLVEDEQERALLRALPEHSSPAELEQKLGFSPTEILERLLERKILTTEVAAIRGVGDKTIRIASLALSAEEIAEIVEKTQKRSPVTARVLRFLLEAGTATESEIAYYTGSRPEALTRLAKKGLISLGRSEVYRRPQYEGEAGEQKAVALNAEQQDAYNRLLDLFEHREGTAALLFGVTGSGKTQVYMKIIEQALALKKTALVLVPEIALTPQLMRIFTGRFGDRIAILHSGLSLGQRIDEWKRIRARKADLVLGTRSAVFAPLEEIGVIVVDEEQEHTYKSENLPRYHAREVAKYRAIYHKALLILGSATPSIESFYAAERKKIARIDLLTRYNREALPQTILADMRLELLNGNSTTISDVLRRELEQNIEEGRQSILLINRRGNSRRLVCGECGFMPECAFCSNALTYHSANGRLMCHLCGRSQETAENCPVCGGSFKLVGAGTQKSEADLKALFGEASVLRMDSDTTSMRGSHEELLDRFREERIPILLGTQMIAKGLDFENVTLVGVLDADQSLHVDDYRAHERTFSLITQVVGRAGRGGSPGRAVIQTFTTNNPVLLAAAAQDYIGFYEEEIKLRQSLGTPPFREIILVTVQGPEEEPCRAAACELAVQLNGFADANALDIRILGPTEAFVFKVSGRYRYQILLNCAERQKPARMVSMVLKAFRKNRTSRRISVYADMNPNQY